MFKQNLCILKTKTYSNIITKLQEFGGNVDKDLERYHYLNSPFIARYVRFHPIDWHKRISMRAGLMGCPYKGECKDGFMRINEYTPCGKSHYHNFHIFNLLRLLQKRYLSCIADLFEESLKLLDKEMLFIL